MQQIFPAAASVIMLAKCRKKNQISVTEYCGNPHYFSTKKSYSETEQLVLAVVSRENEKMVLMVLLKHPRSTRQDLARRLHMNEITANWYLKRLIATKLLTVETDEIQNRYLLTSEAKEACRIIS